MALWGSGLYGQNLYGTDTPGPVDFAGGIAPTISFSASLTIVGLPNYMDFVGNLAPVARFGGVFGFDYALTGNLLPQVTFSGDLSVAVALQGVLMQGGYYFFVNLNGDMISGPLWEMTTPCGPVEWEEAELCHG